jgi:hypothetical protein
MTTIKSIVLTLSAIVLFAAGSYAGTVNKTTMVDSFTTSDGSVNVEFVGEDLHYVFFQVSVKSGGNKNAYLEISDKTEGEIYSSKFNSASKQLLKIEKRNNQELGFTVSFGNETYSKSFILMPTVVLNSVK